MRSLFLGLDVGTQGCKALLWDSKTNEVVSRGSFSYGIIPSDVQGRAEQHPDTWIQGVVGSVKQALQGVQGPYTVLGLGVSGQQHGLVVLDTSMQVLRPAKLWCDIESAPEASELSAKLGTTLVPSFTLTKLLWLKRHEPDVYGRVAHVLLPHDYVNWWLTGRLVMEAGDASGTACFNVHKRTWDTHVIGTVDDAIAGWLPPLVGPGEVIGRLQASAAAALGLPPGISVSPGSGDNAMSALGAGVVEPGQLVVSLGTSGTVFGVAPQPVLDPTGAICPFCDATGGGLPLLCTLNCTVPPQEVASAFGMSHEALTEAASKEAPGCSGVVFLPYLAGERTPNWPKASGAITGLRPGCLRPGLLYRAALEGATFSLVAGVRLMEGHGLKPTEVRLVGGGSRNTLWRRIIADAFQLPVRLPLEAESAALGAALQAAACHTDVPVRQYVLDHPPPVDQEVLLPDPTVREQYAEAYQAFVSRGQQLFGAGTAADN